MKRLKAEKTGSYKLTGHDIRGYMTVRDLDYDPDLANALGRMIVAWSGADGALIDLFCRMTSTTWPMASRAYYRIPTFDSRIQMLTAMLAEWQTPDYRPKAICLALLRLRKLARARNAWVHNRWARDVENSASVIFDYRAKPDTKERTRSVKPSDVINHLDAVHRRTDALLALLKDPHTRSS
jgi:hypothetical protein